MQQAIASTVGVPIGERKRAVAKAAASCCRDEASTAACLRVLFEELLSVDESNGESNGELPCGNAASNTNSNAAVATSTINSDPVEWKRAVCSLLANVCREQDVTDLTAVDGCDEAMCVFLDSKQHDTAHHRTRRAAFHALVTSLHPATALWTRYACRSIDWLLAAYRQDVVEDMRDAVLTLKTAVATVARWIASVHQSVQLNVDENATLSIWLADTVSSLITSFNAAAMGSDAQYLCALVLVQLLEVLHVVEERVLHTVEERSGHFYDDNALVALLVTVLGQVAQHYDTSSATNDIDRRLSWMVMFRTALSGWRYNATCLLEPMSGLNDDTPSMKTRPCLFISLVLPMLAGIAIAPLDVPRRMLVADTLLASMQYQRTHSSHPAVLELWGESSTGADSQVTLTTLRCTLIDDVIWKWMVASDMTYYVQQRLRMSLEAACAIAERVQTSSRPCPFVENMARRTLGLPVHCKTRYLILRVLVGPLNASALIQLHPNLLGECVQALR